MCVCVCVCLLVFFVFLLCYYFLPKCVLKYDELSWNHFSFATGFAWHLSKLCCTCCTGKESSEEEESARQESEEHLQTTARETSHEGQFYHCMPGDWYYRQEISKAGVQLLECWVTLHV